LKKKFSQSAIPISSSLFFILSPSILSSKPSRPTSSQTKKKDMRQLADMLNLNMITAFNQLNIGRAIETPPSLSELISFLY
jgi:hypothetical protein